MTATWGSAAEVQTAVDAPQNDEAAGSSRPLQPSNPHLTPSKRRNIDMPSVIPEASTTMPALTDQRDPLAGLSIVTALVNGTLLPIACPATWCTENHAGDNAQHLEDIGHTGDDVDLYVPAFNGGEPMVFAYAHLGQDLYATDQTREPHIRVEDSGGEASYLTPDQADAFTDSLAAFGAQIRALAQTARLATEETA